MPDYRAESCTIKNISDLKQEWINLQERADCSYFQSWGWVGTWLEHVVDDFEPTLIKIWHNDLLVGMGVFVTKQVTRRGVIHSNTMFLNEYPFDGRNMAIEYNGLLVDKMHRQAVYQQAIEHLLSTKYDVDEFFFSGLCEGEDVKLLKDSHVDDKISLNVLEISSAWSVDLDTFEPEISAFLETLSKNRRAQIRRSMQLYENQGGLQINEAQTMDDALVWFDELKKLHTNHWVNKGQPGSFANPRWEAFHRALIQNRFHTGEIQLLKASNETLAIGYLYNFVWRKRVYVLQTGFSDSLDKKLMPGYVTHVLAIVYNKVKGMSVYDLMHGDSLYKRLLCNQSHTLIWMVLQRRQLRFEVEKVAVDVIRGFRKMIRFGH
ncbi:MAG: GNAT family N-acetyltransferase [Gammaproteobacteria bacterium]|nr:GNAT family N-acetyltransferase [Gammaproteobacteria bacterium]